ncbi:restriction endonuclease subunit S [Streptomyces sp. NPDC006976]|uniref:restriction endonuclease subunit S n=1 Tax=Streptomyces sp. NPDC006976 TaxID=3154311 RepID=UPI0033DA268B
MRDGWRSVSLGEILKLRSERTHSVSTLLSVTADRGVIRQSDSGRRDSSSVDKSLYWDVCSGDVVYNTMRMWQGVSGVASEGGIVSPAYTVCEPVEGVDSRYIGWLLKEPKQVARFLRRSQGLVSDTWNLKYSEFKMITVELPPLPEQRKVAEILDELDLQIHTVKASAEKESASLRAAITARLSDSRHPRQILRSLLKGRPKNGFSPIEADGWTGYLVLGLGCLTPAGFVPRQLKPVAPELAAGNHATLSEGDVLVSRANTRELVGLAGVYRDVGVPCIYPDLMMRLTPRAGVPSEFLELALGLPESRRRIQALSQGTSESMVKITSSVIENLEVPFPEAEARDELLEMKREVQLRWKVHADTVDKLGKQKRALSDDLLTGRTRVFAPK